MSIIPRTDGTNPLDKHFRDADAYARSIENVPLDWWPMCVDQALGVTRRQLKATARMERSDSACGVVLDVELPLHLGRVQIHCTVNRELKAKRSVDEALKGMRAAFGLKFLEALLPADLRYCLLVWDERRNDER